MYEIYLPLGEQNPHCRIEIPHGSPDLKLSSHAFNC